jgi:hypothetical protein
MVSADKAQIVNTVKVLRVIITAPVFDVIRVPKDDNGFCSKKAYIFMKIGRARDSYCFPIEATSNIKSG